MTTATVAILSAVCLPPETETSETDYKELRRVSGKVEYFQITYNRTFMEISAPAGDERISVEFRLEDMSPTERGVYFEERKVFDKDGLLLDRDEYTWDRVYDLRVSVRNVIPCCRRTV
jgi:hypothetical protein